MTDRIVTKPSPLSVPRTVHDLRDLGEGRDKLFAVIDHSGEAAANGLELRDTKVVVFGNPKAGNAGDAVGATSRARPALKVLVWADDGQTS